MLTLLFEIQSQVGKPKYNKISETKGCSINQQNKKNREAIEI